uniref:BTB/POZ domain-containing protein 16 n=1 Tax=Sphenodon punctatus TaxID=8508 RepID=A0A8D0H9G7_SPHPU
MLNQQTCKKHRFFRKQAGSTNRWQFPYSLSCDLLGLAQANKAFKVCLNETLMRIILMRSNSISLFLDVTLECLGFQWELHRIYLFKSETLSQLLILELQKDNLCAGDSPNKIRKGIGKTQKPHSREDKVHGVTRSLAIALRNLYSRELEVEEEDVLGVLAAASELQFPSLFQKWLEVNLVAQLCGSIHLRKLPQELLQKVLKSSRLFTYNEFHLLKTALYWVYLQQNPKIQIIPSYETILLYFSSLPKRCSFLEREAGQRYIAIFQSLRLHGITSSKLIPRYHAEIICIYGFFFEIKAVRHKISAYSFYMQRFKHTDPIISFFTAERSPVSLRQEREVKYEIKAQYQTKGEWRELSTDQRTKKFGVSKPACKSKVSISK